MRYQKKNEAGCVSWLAFLFGDWLSYILALGMREALSAEL